jgi:two-component system, NtrC family, sensor kinase
MALNLNSDPNPSRPLLPGAMESLGRDAAQAHEPPRVLVADDDPVVRIWLVRLLKRWGYAVTVVADGPEALAILEGADPPHLAVLDKEMPGMGGLEICRLLRAKYHIRYSYIILLTSSHQESDLIEGLRAGADEYLNKPCNPSELKVRLETGVRIAFQKNLRESEKRFQSAVESSAVGTGLSDMDGKWLQINQAFVDFFGYTREELMSLTFRELTHEDYMAKSEECFRALASGATNSYQMEKRYVRKDGSLAWALLTVSLVRNADGAPASVLAQIQDIGKRKEAEEALRQSEALFRAISENAAELIMLVDLNGTILYVSPAYETLLGYSPQDLLCANAFERLLHPEDGPAIKARTRVTLRTGQAETVQVRFRHKDGSWRTVETHAGIIRNRDGKVDRLVITARIMDDWIAIQQVLQDREEQFKLLLDSTAEAIYGLDLAGNCTFCNKAFLRMTGYGSVDEFLGQNVHRLIHHHRPDGSRYPEGECRIYEALRRNRGTHADDEFMWRADGSGFPVEYWSYPVWKDGRRVGAVVTFVDITNRKAAEDALRAANSESELVINSVPSILLGLDSDTRITQWNLAAESTFGIAKAQVMGKPLNACGIKWLNPGMAEEIAAWLKVETVQRYENIRFDKNGETRFLGITVSSVDLANHATGQMLITGADTTERKVLEEQLRQAQKLEAIGQLAAGIAHEINTPTQFVGDNMAFLGDAWNSIRGLLSRVRTVRQEAPGVVSETTLQDFDSAWDATDVDYLEKEVPKAIEQSLEGVRRVGKIVKAMSEFSHPGTEEKHLVDLNRAIESTLTVARNEWKYVANVEKNLDPDLPLVLCHLGEINQALLNLVVNAAHAIADVNNNGFGEKGLISIATRREGDWVEFSIRDTGTGIPEGIRSRIFEPFFTTKEVGKGTGQGLALAHAAIVKKHGGRIWFESEIGKGTTFFACLPTGSSGAAL